MRGIGDCNINTGDREVAAKEPKPIRTRGHRNRGNRNYGVNGTNRCEERLRLESEVTAALEHLAQITTAQLDWRIEILCACSNWLTRSWISRASKLAALRPATSQPTCVS